MGAADRHRRADRRARRRRVRPRRRLSPARRHPRRVHRRDRAAARARPTPSWSASASTPATPLRRDRPADVDRRPRRTDPPRPPEGRRRRRAGARASRAAAASSRRSPTASSARSAPGDVDLAAVADALERIGFDGWAVFEQDRAPGAPGARAEADGEPTSPAPGRDRPDREASRGRPLIVRSPDAGRPRRAAETLAHL